jgi:hypothetical protein
MSFDVIVAGYGRTGTLSVKTALEELGYRPCWHIEDMTRRHGRADNPLRLWQQLAEGRAMDWTQLLDGFRAGSDFPLCLYHRELMACFPDARVVLTVREPLAWAQSMQQLRRHFLAITSQSTMASEPSAVWREVMEALVWSRFPDIDDAHALAAQFAAHEADVRRNVPADRLLVLDVRQGWAPLCGFLGHTPPAIPFPRLNDRSELKT